MENSNVNDILRRNLNSDETSEIAGGKREEATFDKLVLAMGADKAASNIAKTLGMDESVMTSSSYLDDHDGEEPYNTIEVEIKLSCPKSKLSENNVFKEMFGE